MDTYVEIVREDGSLDRMRVEKDQFTIGRSTAAGVALPDRRDLENDHVLIAPRADGFWASVNKAGGVPVLLNNVPISAQMVPWDSTLTIGTLRIKLSNRPPVEAKKGEAQASPVTIIGGVGITVALVFLLLGPTGGGGGIEPAPEPLPLFETTGTCPVSGGPEALSRADLFAETALGKSERYPFEPSDGVMAVFLFQQAAGCFRAGSEPSLAAEAERDGQRMQARAQEDYDGHRLRLSRALELQRWVDARNEARSIGALLDGQAPEHPYMQWLARTERQLQLLSSAP